MLKRIGLIVFIVTAALAALSRGVHEAAAATLYPDAFLENALSSAGQVRSADLNGDGRPDLVIAGVSTSSGMGGAWVYLAAAKGGYSAPVFYATSSALPALAVKDVNGDGYPDIVAAYGNLSVLINKGDGTFAPHVDSAIGVPSGSSLAVGDVTGDGKADAVIAKPGDLLYIVPGNGDGTFDSNTADIQTLWPTTYSERNIVLADINGDGVPDIVTAGGCNDQDLQDDVNVFLGRAGGVFPSKPDQSISVGGCPTVVVKDVNGDGMPDAVVENRDGESVQVLLNQGGLLQKPGKTYNLPAGSFPLLAKVADIDGDGHPDIYAADSGGDNVNVLYGKGDGTFSAPALVNMGFTVSGVIATDVDGDGRPDLVATGVHGPNYQKLLVSVRNMGGRKFRSYRNYTYQDSSGAGVFAVDIASADFNGDGRPDVVVLGRYSLSVLLNTGSGRFGAPRVIGLPSVYGPVRVNAVVAGDVNGDGVPDIVTADSAGHLYAFLGNGDGTFQSPVVKAIATGDIYGLALGDVDGDGHVDVVAAANGSDQVQICNGLGDGRFRCAGTINLPGPPIRIALRDFNGDGRLDFAVTTSATDSTFQHTYAFVYLGDGKGGYGGTPSSTLLVPGYGWGIAVGDLNGDGVPDLVFGSNGNSISVSLGAKGGLYGSPKSYASGISGGSAPQDVAIADVNGDGLPDVIAANAGESTVSVFINQGRGVFGAPENFAAGDSSAGQGYVYPLLVRDVDGDRLPDILTVNANPNSTGERNNTVSVYLHNHAPKVANEAFTTQENRSVSGVIAATDADADSLSFSLSSHPAHGGIALDPGTGAFDYTPNQNYTGKDRFVVKVGDGLNFSTCTVAITIRSQAGASGGASQPSSGGGGGGLGALGLLLLAAVTCGADMRRRYHDRH